MGAAGGGISGCPLADRRLVRQKPCAVLPGGGRRFLCYQQGKGISGQGNFGEMGVLLVSVRKTHPAACDYAGFCAGADCMGGFRARGGADFREKARV